METNYSKYRGGCKKECEKLIKGNSKLILVRGYYHEPIWNTKEEHFWCVDENGNIIDPTKKQFPSGGISEFYEEFNGFVDCEECGISIPENEIVMQGRFPVCSHRCACRLVGLEDYQ